MLAATLLFCLFVAIAANPYEEFRSNLEFLSDDTNLADPAYRLYEYVQPKLYRVHLDTFLEQSTFKGTVEIEVDIDRVLSQIVLHQKVVQIETINVKGTNNVDIPLTHEIDDYYELLKINFEVPIVTGSYTIEITYDGKINKNPLDRGFYEGYYYVDGVIEHYATTQFQPYHARKAFPCFDEPQFKSKFIISITRASDYSKSYSNMAITNTETIGQRVRETFGETPIISAYLIAFHVSKFVETVSSDTTKPFAVISRPGPINQHSYALDIGPKITDELDKYLQINYYEMGQDMKNDHIALPDFPSGAMENWGMVNYREAYLLYDEENTNVINKIFIATIMAHELAHKWFGNLVTCFWWSNLWLNESFASFFEYFGAHMADENLELDAQFVVDYVHSALLSDTSITVNAMNWSGVESNPSISAHFSTTSYAKGASVLRMMEHFVGPETFRKALNIYLVENSYDVGTPIDMYDAFKQAVNADNSLEGFTGIDIEEVFDSWVQTPGAPILNVQVESDSISVTQSRYAFSENVPDDLWKIPLTYSIGINSDFEDTKPKRILTEKTMKWDEQVGGNWVIFNNAQSGYYRVNYDEANWRKIAEALRTQRERIHRFNRAQIVNDVLIYVRGYHMEPELAFDILSFLKDETDYYVWVSALGQFEWMRRRLEHMPGLQKEFEIYLLEQMETVVEHLGFVEDTTDSTSTILNRMQILNFVCTLGHDDCNRESLALWNTFKQNNNNVPVNFRRYVYCTGVKEGDRSDYDFLLQKYRESDNTADMVVMLRALACSKDQDVIHDYLQESLYNDLIRIHDKTNAFSYALQGNPENIKTVLKFLQTDYQNIIEHYGGIGRLDTSIRSLSNFLTQLEDINEFNAWLHSNQVALVEVFSAGLSAMRTSELNMIWGNRISVDLHNFLRTRNAAGGLITSFTLLFASIIVHLVR